MSDIGSNLPVSLKYTETRQMTLKWIKSKKQECKSKIVHFKQAIEDLMQGKIPEIERQILAAEQELKQLEAHEAAINASVDTQAVEDK